MIDLVTILQKKLELIMLREYYNGLGERERVVASGPRGVRSTCYCFSISRKSQNLFCPQRKII